MNDTGHVVARGLLDLAAVWLFLQYVLPVVVMLGIAYFVYRAVRKPAHTEFAASEPDELELARRRRLDDDYR